jgi:tRNA/rRNA methyltransferase
MMDDLLKNVVVVLVGTKYPGNIGSVARAMHNMGLTQLRLAAPKCGIDEDSLRMARSGEEVLSNARFFSSLKTALRGTPLVIGTSAKTGGKRQESFNPRSLAAKILDHAARQKVAVVFGPEDTGLVDDDLMLCHLLLRIPTDRRGRSINLSQAAMIVCYELFMGHLAREPARVPRLATVEQIESMYVQLEEALRTIGFLHEENARHMMFRFRRLFGRAGLEKSDVSILRGVARQIAWYGSRKSRN